MGTPRIYQNQPLLEGKAIQLDENGSNHLARVLRLKEGHPVILFNGTGGEYHGQISSVSGKKVSVYLDFFNEADRRPHMHIHLGQVISKGTHMDYAIQKAVELGVSEITPLFSQHCTVRLKGARLAKKVEQWRHLVLAACEQSGLNIIPTVNEPISLQQWCEGNESHVKWILHTEDLPTNPFSNQTTPDSVSFAVGPEGGFAEEEIELAKQQGFHCLTLGPRVWRTETAPVVLLSLIQMQWGDFQEED